MIWVVLLIGIDVVGFVINNCLCQIEFLKMLQMTMVIIIQLSNVITYQQFACVNNY